MKPPQCHACPEPAYSGARDIEEVTHEEAGCKVAGCRARHWRALSEWRFGCVAHPVRAAKVRSIWDRFHDVPRAPIKPVPEPEEVT